MNFVRSLMFGMICTSVVAADTSGAQPAAGDAVIVNTQPLTAEEKQALEQRFAIRTYPGRYWYDAVSGAWDSNAARRPDSFRRDSGWVGRYAPTHRAAAPAFSSTAGRFTRSTWQRCPNSALSGAAAGG